MEAIAKQQFDDNGVVKDHIDTRSNSPCETVPPEERYTFIPSRHVGEPAKVIAGEPIFENPCSYEAVEKVLDHLLEEAGVGDSRQWTAVGCDGLPYVLASRIIEEIYICPTCRRQFERDEFLSHMDDSKHADDLEHGRKYRNVLMLTGHGHFEINMTKALFKLLWDVCLAELAKMLGFRSPKALASCQSAHDHHKSWQMLEIFLYAMSAEMLLPYVLQAKERGQIPSVQGFLDYQRTPNEKLMLKIVFDFSLALHVFRAGVRRNNSEVILASRSKFSPLFFGLNMPFYMEAYIRDSKIRVQCPSAVHDFIAKNESYTVSGNESKGEGGDFVLENLNRKSKSFMPPGLPTDDKWLTICRNIDKLDLMRLNMQTHLGLTEKDTEYTYTYDITEEITAFRHIIRERQYLQQHSLTTLTNKPLDSSFFTFLRTRTKQQRFTLHTHYNTQTFIQTEAHTHFHFGRTQRKTHKHCKQDKS